MNNICPQNVVQWKYEIAENWNTKVPQNYTWVQYFTGYSKFWHKIFFFQMSVISLFDS